MDNLKQFIEGKTKFGHSFEIFIQVLILVSLASLTVETLPNISVIQKNFLSYVDNIIVFIFIIEYILRVWVSEKKRKFVFSFYGIADLLAILPSLFLLGFDLQFIRVLRFLRVFRLLKLARYNKALDRVQRAFGIAKEELFIFVTTITSMLYFASVGIYQFEHAAQPENFVTSIFDQQKSKKIIYIFSVFVLVSVVYVTFVSEIYGKKSRPSDDVFLNSQTIKIPSY